MKNQNENNLEHLFDAIKPECSGIIWITDEALNYKLSGVYEFNYLLNGLLGQSISRENYSPSNGNHFFLSQNFGKTFFISHWSDLNDNSLKEVKLQFKNIESSLPKPSEIFVYSTSQKIKEEQIIKNLTQTFTDYTFKKLNPGR